MRADLAVQLRLQLFLATSVVVVAIARSVVVARVAPENVDGGGGVMSEEPRILYLRYK